MRTGSFMGPGPGPGLGRRRSRLEVWVPAGYLALVVGLLVWADVLVRTGDGGFAGVWAIFATAPLSMLALSLFTPSPESLGALEAAPPAHTGPTPPTPLPAPTTGTETELPVGPPPTAAELRDVPDVPGADLANDWLGFGFYGLILACALANATALWALTRTLVGAFSARRARRARPVG
ncbi:SCO4225 family membrane protein [Streptomyces sp. NPDC014870]|uniref:SCO4225 family membrane protein n=1 Tax=Streptomyces sp. NPDC014870 TaxID=3364925 RepID=UPI0036F82C45